jgi:hypothetical protein
MAWIEASLHFAGRFASGEKAAYMARFGVEPAQVSQDQALFARELNKRLEAPIVEVDKGRLGITPGGQLPFSPGPSIGSRL